MSINPETIVARPRARARDLLKAYYTSNAQAIKSEHSPLDIDSEFFDNTQYLAKLIKETHLVDIIKKDNELISEIREIDGNMQTLVYENYGQFISATDTIKLMKNSVDSMDIEFDQLCKVIDNMSTKTAQVHESMSPKRNQIQSLYSTHDLLNKLNFIFELPQQLKKCLKNSNWEGAAFFYNRSAQLMDKYKDQAMFKSIEKESKLVLDKIVVKLKELIIRESATIPEIAHNFGLLISLDQAPPFEVALLHLDILKKRIILTIPKIDLISKIVKAGSNQITQSMAILIHEILGPYAILFDSFCTYYFNDSFEMPVTQTTESFINHQNRLNLTQRETLNSLLKEQNDTFCVVLFDKVSGILPVYKSKAEKFKLIECFESLDLIHGEVDRYLIINTLYKLDEILSIFTISYFDGIVQSIYKSITSEIIDKIMSTNEDSVVVKVEVDIVKRIQVLHEQAVMTLKMFLEWKAYKSSLVDCMKKTTSGISTTLVQSFKNIIIAESSNPFCQIFLSRILLSISKVVPAIHGCYLNALLVDSNSLTENHPSLANVLQRKCIDILEHNSKTALDKYMEVINSTACDKMSAYLSFMESSLHAKPTAVSPLLLQLTTFITRVGQDCTRVYPEKRKRTQSTVPTRSQSHTSQFNGLFDKLFSDKNIYFAPLERNYMALQVHLFMLLFKFMLEEIRNCIVFEWALGQFEIDFEFLKRTVGEILSSDTRLYGLALDISACFSKRCVDGKSCDAKEVGRIVVAGLPKSIIESE